MLMAQRAGNNNNVNATVVVFGDHSNIHPPGRYVLPNNQEEIDAPPENSANEEKVVCKVSNILKSDYLKNGKFNCNPLKPQQAALKDMFVQPVLQHVDYRCDSGGNSSVSMNKIFSPHNGCDSPRRVLIYGKSLTGKSILCQKYAHDWANPDLPSSEPFRQFKIVIFLKLCDVKGTLEEILETEVFRKELTQDEKTKFFSYMNKNPQEFLFILDGVSECNLEGHSDLKDFMLDRGQGRFYVIATTHPDPRGCGEICKTFHLRFRICGYNKDDVLDYVSKYFRDNRTKCDELKECLESGSDLMALANIPLMAMIICELWQEKDSLLTLTQVLRCYTSFMVESKLNSNGDLSTFEDLAKQGVTKSLEEFTKEELRLCKVEVDLSNGFLNAKLGKESFVFAHEKVLQYFAAKWIIRNWEMEGLVEFLNSMPSAVFIFLAGEFAEMGDKRLLEFLGFTKPTCFKESCYCRGMDLFLACVAEAWKEKNCKEILNLCIGIEAFRNTKTPNNYPLVMSLGAARGLGYIVPNLKLSVLNLSGIIILHPQAKIIASKCFYNGSKLRSVKFSHSCLSSDSVQVICEALESLIRLEEVDLSLCCLGVTGLRAVANLVMKAKGEIRSLHLVEDLDENHLKKEENSHPGRHLAKQDSLTDILKLDEFQEKCKINLPTEESIMALIDAVNGENDLKDISLPPSSVGNLLSQWFDVFRKNTKLERIKIYLPVVDDTVQKELVTLVNEMPQLAKICVFLVNEGSHIDNSTYSLEQKTEGKIKLNILDHTQSVSHPLKVLARSVIHNSPYVVALQQTRDDPNVEH